MLQWWSYAKKSRESWPEYWRSVGRHWIAVALGVVLAAVGAIQVVFISFGVQWSLWLVASVVCLTVEQFFAFHDVRTQRDEARSRRARFPDAEIEVETYFCVPLETHATPPACEIALIFTSRVTNREPSQRVNLTFDMHLVWVPKHHPTSDLRSRLFATREKTNRKYEDDLFPSILELDPSTTKQGFLSFTYYSLGLKDDRWIEFSDWGGPEDGLPTKFTPFEDHYFLLTVHDFVSGESIEFAVPGSWPPGPE